MGKRFFHPFKSERSCNMETNQWIYTRNQLTSFLMNSEKRPVAPN